MSISSNQHCVYIITFPNGKFYIGCTMNLDARMIQHATCNNKTAVSEEFNSHNKDDCTVKVVCENQSHKTALSIEGKIIDAFYYHADCLNQRNPNGISTKVNKKISRRIKQLHKEGRYPNSNLSANKA